MRIKLWAGVAFLTLAGCSVTSAVRLSDKNYAPLAPGQVRVFMSAEEVPGPYEKIAIITSEGDSFQKTALIENMKKKAAGLGANGLILGQFRTATTGEKVAQAFLWTSANNTHEATAIRLRPRKRPSAISREAE
ncbi:MAG: hypothetical protein AB7V08_02370 [Elusimicrobiales bacterium]